jgi:tetratricopeptide (TPR) repeat protein
LKNVNHNVTHGTKPRRAKRYLVGILVFILVLAISATALADNGRGAGGNGGQPKLGGSPSQPPQSSPEPSSTGKGQPSQHGNGTQNTEKPGVNTDKIAKAIAALDDEALQASLTALLETYEDALEAKQEALDAKDTTNLSTLASAAGAAKDALDAALEAAGIDTDSLYGVPEAANDGTGRMQNRPTMDSDEIAAAIAALDDLDTNKAALTTLLKTYETALEAQSSADTSSMTNDELKALADAVQSAEQALLEATKTAGITGGVGRGQFVNGYGQASLDTESIATKIAALGDTDANKAMLTSLLEAYQAALATQNAGDASKLTTQEMAQLGNATQKAELALEQALKNAGLADEPILAQNQRQIQVKTEASPSPAPTYELNVVGDEPASTGTESTNLFSAFLAWLNNLVK